MSDEYDELKKQLTIDKDLIDVMPKNGIRKIKTLIQTIEDMKEKYIKHQIAIEKEIKDRYANILDVTKNDEIDKLEIEVEGLEKITSENKKMLPMEKIHLDEIMYSINGFYKKNLVIINKDIYDAIKKFAEVNITLTSEDFNISEYTEKYIKVLIEEAKNGTLNSDRMKETFEKVYSECSDIIYQIYANIRLIYDKNLKNIEKFIEKEEQENFAKYNKSSEELITKKEELISEKDKLIEVDKKIILDNFFTGIWDVNDYTIDNYEKAYERLTTNSSTSFDEETKKEIDSNISKLYQELEEYRQFLNYKYIVDEIIKIKKSKEKSKEQEKAKKGKEKAKKDQFEIEKDTINKLTDEIAKLNKEFTKKSFLLKKVSELEKQENILKRNTKIMLLKNEYIKINRMDIENRIESDINNTSKILDALKFATFNYDFLAKIIIKQIPEVTDSEISQMVKDFKKFMGLTVFTVLNNINIDECKNIAIIIKDKYKMFGLNLTKEDFEESSIDDLIKQVQIVKNYNDIKRSGLEINAIKFALQTKELINTKKED